MATDLFGSVRICSFQTLDIVSTFRKFVLTRHLRPDGPNALVLLGVRYRPRPVSLRRKSPYTLLHALKDFAYVLALPPGLRLAQQYEHPKTKCIRYQEPTFEINLHIYIAIILIALSYTE